MNSGADPADSLIGELIDDRYRILRLIGRGGMGAVYEAEATRLGRRCAVKVLLPEHNQRAAVVERFRREAHVAARVKHPNVVEIFDTGTTRGGFGYIAMELLTGETLDHTLRRDGRIPWPRAKHIVLQLCRALAVAHGRRVVHRDMKLENCFRITLDDDPDHLKVLDFGIAKLMEPDADQATPLTATNSVVGTYAYMAYEQVSGMDCDHRVDIWAVGIILYQLLTGSLPFKGHNQGQIWLAIVQHTPPPLAHVAPDADIPAAVEAIVTRALEKHRDARYPTIEALALDLINVDGIGTASGRIMLPTGYPSSLTIDAQALTIAGVDALDQTELDSDPLARDTDGATGDTVDTTDPGAQVLAPPAEQHATVIPDREPLPVPPPIHESTPRRSHTRLAALAIGATAAIVAVALLLSTPPDPQPLPEPVVPPSPSAPPSEPAAAVEPPPAPTPAPPLEPALPPVAGDPAEPATPASSAKRKPPTGKKTPTGSFTANVLAELKRLKKHLATRPCFADVGKQRVDVALEISPATGKAFHVSVTAPNPELTNCAKQALAAFRFSTGSLGEPIYVNPRYQLNP